MRKEILLNIQYWVNQIGLIKLNLERNRHNLMNLTFDNFLKNHKQKQSKIKDQWLEVKQKVCKKVVDQESLRKRNAIN